MALYGLYNSREVEVGMNRVTISPCLTYFIVLALSGLLVYSVGVTLIAVTLGETIKNPAFAEEMCKKEGLSYGRV